MVKVGVMADEVAVAVAGASSTPYFDTTGSNKGSKEEIKLEKEAKQDFRERREEKKRGGAGSLVQEQKQEWWWCTPTTTRITTAAAETLP